MKQLILSILLLLSFFVKSQCDDSSKVVKLQQDLINANIKLNIIQSNLDEYYARRKTGLIFTASGLSIIGIGKLASTYLRKPPETEYIFGSIICSFGVIIILNSNKFVRKRKVYKNNE